MITRHLSRWAVVAFVSTGWAQNQSAAAGSRSKDSSSDATQSIVSPLGMGSGATLAITQKGTNVTAAIGRQIVDSPINFWQVGLVGSLDKNGQQQVYSSSQSDAPGFKGKIGFGHSSMIRAWPEWHHSADRFLLNAWCLDLLTEVGKTLPAAHAPKLDTAGSCSQAVNIAGQSLTDFPPLDTIGQVDKKTQSEDQTVVNLLGQAAGHMAGVADDQINAALLDQFHICNTLVGLPKLLQVCTNPKGVTDQQAAYPALAHALPITGEPSPWQWKIWGSWAPTVISAAYRPLAGGVYDLSDKKNWTRLLNAAVGDVAVYHGRYAFGMEGGYGQTVKITNQDVCNNFASGTYTAQQCDSAMLGEPKPVNAWLVSGTLQISPLPKLAKGVPLATGAQATYSYTAPRSGGHSSELAIPIYLASSTSPMSFVVGVQPTWDWNSDPTVGNKFYVSLFVGARPPVPTPVTK